MAAAHELATIVFYYGENRMEYKDVSSPVFNPEVGLLTFNTSDNLKMLVAGAQFVQICQNAPTPEVKVYNPEALAVLER